MRNKYDFSKAKRNPYAKKLKRQVTIRLDDHTVTYFKELSQEIGIPYQTLIKLYLRDFATTGRKLSIEGELLKVVIEQGNEKEKTLYIDLKKYLTS